jgi:predicted deacylase
MFAIALALMGAGVLAFWLVSREVEPAPEAPAPVEAVRREVIGASVEGREIEAFTYGTGADRLLFVGGIHGGYEWNSALLAYQVMDELAANPSSIPGNVSVTIVPSANPDGAFDVIGKEGRFALADVPADEGPLGNGRFNANGVDLNRNFDCKWQPTSTWRGNAVSAGTAAFSEPEAAAIRDLALRLQPKVAVFWHSQANAVYASECENGILPETRAAMSAYALAAGYKTVDTFDAYPVTGDVEGWLASVGIPAITVELATHKDVEFEKNLAGVRALLGRYGL